MNNIWFIFVSIFLSHSISGNYHASFTTYLNSKNLWKNIPHAFNIKKCEPIQFILYARHASRYPGKKAIMKMSNFLPNIKESLLKNVYVNESIKILMRSWFNQYNQSVHHLLSKSGELEMFHLGRRYRERFEDLLGPNFIFSQEYRSTAKQRTEQSAFMFGSGALGKNGMKNFKMTEPLKIDPLLRFYKSCDKWIKEVDKSKQAHVQEEQYLVSEAYLGMMKRVSKRIFPLTNRILNHDEIKAIYLACSFDYLINENRSSPWCSVLTNWDLQVLEFWEDIEHYWTDGYPYAITYEQACRPVEDIINNFQMVLNGTNSKKAVLRFSHLGLILKIFARFGLFKDKINLTSYIMDQSNNKSGFNAHSRLYRMSKIGPMASNIAFVLYNCSSNYKVKAFVQEHEVKINGCPDRTCSLERFLHEYQKIAENCDVDKICQI